jgi:hypothetical protein
MGGLGFVSQFLAQVEQQPVTSKKAVGHPAASGITGWAALGSFRNFEREPVASKKKMIRHPAHVRPGRSNGQRPSAPTRLATLGKEAARWL